MRTLKRSFLAAIAVAALVVSATSAQAAVVNLVVDQSQSTLTMGGFINAGAINPNFSNLPFTPQAAGSNTTSWGGTINIDDLGATLQLLPGSNVVANVNGVWGPAPTANGNYGLAIPGIGLTARFQDMTFDFGIPGPDPAVIFPVVPVVSTPMPVVAGSFNLSGQGAGLTGISALWLVSGLGSGGGTIDDSPIISFGSTGADIGTWDGTTLTLPVHSTTTTVIQASPLVLQTITMTGQIVARVVPEPSSVIMAGLGVVGLIATGYRARKRKA
jgi:hypothetical protein